MSHTKPDQTRPATVDEAEVVAYLQQHPDLFQHQPQLLEHLHLPHDCGDATSLIERQIQILRQRVEDYGTKMSALVQTAHRNDGQFEKTRQLVLQLAAAPSLDDTQAALQKAFYDDFGADSFSLMLFVDPMTPPATTIRCVAEAQAKQYLTDLLKHKWARCLLPTPAQLDYLFEDLPTTTEFQSAALMPLYQHEQALGLCCVASQQKNHFHEQLDTLFLNHVADVTSRVTGRLLQAPAT